VSVFRSDFPFFTHYPNALYFDNAATTQKPQCVLESMQHSYVHLNANVHRSSYGLAQQVTEAFEGARNTLANFINSPHPNQIVWTKGATESVNLLAYGLASANLLDGDEVILLVSEHHANLLPWRRLAEQCGLNIVYHGISEQGDVDYDALLGLISDNTALIACAHVSNVLGTIHPVKAIAAKAKAHGALCIIDGTQAVAHLDVDVQAIGCDAYVFSSHKMFGPTGVGVLYGTTSLLTALGVYHLGGEMVQHVSLDEVTYQSAPLKFEAGTPALHGVLGLACAVNYLQQHRFAWFQHEKTLQQALLNACDARPELTVYGRQAMLLGHAIPLVSFNHESINGYDLLQQLQPEQVSLRVGQHCAMPLQHALGIDSSIRVSLAGYNTIAEIERFFALMDDLTASKQITVPLDRSLNQALTGTHTAQSKVKQNAASNPVEKLLNDARGFTAINRALMLASKHCPMLDASEHSDQYLVSGCEVSVYLKHDGQIWRGYSQSKIIRGLLAVLLLRANELLDTTQDYDFNAYLDGLGVTQVLSQSRVSGLGQIIARLSA
jgi:cysteine desulfurase / selenocysteine lyase